MWNVELRMWNVELRMWNVELVGFADYPIMNYRIIFLSAMRFIIIQYSILIIQ